MLSGVDGSVLHTLLGGPNSYGVGDDVAGVGDVNGDGRDDFAISARWKNGPAGTHAGAVYVYSGADFSLVRTHYGFAANESLVWEIANAGDIDGDGVNDLLAGADGAKLNGMTVGVARIFSGANGSILGSVHGYGGTRLGYSVSSVGDLTGDGVPEFVLGDPRHEPVGPAWNGAARIFSMGHCGDVQDYAPGCAGAGGFTPVLKVTGCPVSHEEVILEVEDAMGQEMALLLFGLVPANASIDASCVLALVPIGPQIVLPIYGAPTPGEGFTKVAGHLPAILAEVTVKMQIVCTDPTKPTGMTITNAVDVTVIP